MSRKRRFKKIIKGYLNRIANDGAVHDDVDTQAEKKALLATIDAENNATLLARFNFSDPGLPTETFDVENDGGTFKNDPAPFDERDFQDTDGDTIGDNEDIILTKIRLDAIFQDMQKTTPGSKLATRPLGTLQQLMDEAEAIRLAVKAIYDPEDGVDHDGDFAEGDKANAVTALAGLRTNGATVTLSDGVTQVTVSKERFTEAGSDGFNALLTEIDRQAALVASLKAEIAAMTADADVAFPGAKFGDYTAVGDSADAHTGAANTGAGVDGSVVIATVVATAKEHINKVATGDGTSGAKVMIDRIDA